MTNITVSFSANGWRRLPDGRLEHISGLMFKKILNGDVEIVSETLGTFIQNLKKEGVQATQAQKLLAKLAQQAQEHFLGLN
ncbi:hypothetical protein V757_08360 [Pelistega indica]|uniref:Uncharacterized protein n=1 Tax=Pelistega indica TaxID=1414851 RepID=V8G1T8_9BURK|nr:MULTISPECIES: hypothetical protein [Pelistega]ETD70046.1 hypothetical protein V757_08360 [Pelistega indica]